jgi:trehalose-6-phosphatase
MGDDVTDGEMFRALPPGSLTIGVGAGPAGAAWYARDYRAIRHTLRILLEHSAGGAFPEAPGDAGST